jgi:hypothetical protein
MCSAKSSVLCLDATAPRNHQANRLAEEKVPEILGANGELYTTLSSRVVSMAKFRALFGCLRHGALHHPGTPSMPWTVPLPPSNLGLPLNRSTTEGRLVSTPCRRTVCAVLVLFPSAAWDTLVLAECDRRAIVPLYSRHRPWLAIVFYQRRFGAYRTAAALRHNCCNNPASRSSLSRRAVTARLHQRAGRASSSSPNPVSH